MPRRKRLYLPGVAFHITARAHQKEHCFGEDLRDQMVATIASMLSRSDAQLIAFSVLSNHYHLVVQQGNAPLAQLLQPINRQIALAVHRNERRKGHVFERRFFAKPCVDADQLREVIVYTHRNAVRAKLCAAPESWSWSSHRAYVDEAAKTGQPKLRIALELFANAADGGDARAGYLRYIEWRAACDALTQDDIKPTRPPAQFGDQYYTQFFSRGERADRSPERDLRDVILRSIKEIDPNLTIDDLRFGWRTRPMVAIRRSVIVSAIRARHRVADIARFLQMSDTAVSRVSVSVSPRPPVRFDN